MHPPPDHDTIYALSTPPGHAALAVFRISGPHIATLSATILHRPSTELQPRQAHLRTIYSPDGTPIDHGIVLRFVAPHSFTGEDMLELHLHGSRAVIKDFTAALAQIEYLRPAEPGEFTRRAFVNGKLDLMRVEALQSLIDAETSQQRLLALQQMSNPTAEPLYSQWRQQLVTSLAQVEAYIDFPEDDVPHEILAQTAHELQQMQDGITAHLGHNQRSQQIMEGWTVAIIGEPNVGKSTILNRLAKEEVAIVSDQAGTTRDVIRVRMDIGGSLVILADTAGIRESQDIIENLGIEKAKTMAKSADILFWVLDLSRDLALQINIGRQILSLADTQKNDTAATPTTPVICILNKSDLVTEMIQTQSMAQLRDVFNVPSIAAVVPFSYKDTASTIRLLDALEQTIATLLPEAGDMALINARQQSCLQQCAEALQSFAQNLPQLEIAAQDLRFAATSLGILLGSITIDEVLEEIFSSFCIGK